jgi:hypothetical protein
VRLLDEGLGRRLAVPELWLRQWSELTATHPVQLARRQIRTLRVLPATRQAK